MSVEAQNNQASNVSQVIMTSTLTTRQITTVNAAGIATFTPTTGNTTLPVSLLGVYTGGSGGNGNINNPGTYTTANTSALVSAFNTNIALALSVTPVESPTSGVILRKDPITGAELPVSSTLGPIFTKRAETIGKGKFYIGLTHQSYHFTSFNGQNLNGTTVVYGGGDTSGLTAQGAAASGGNAAKTLPATLNLGLDVRLSQDVAFLTYGITNRFDVSVGLSMVHSSVASTAYNGIIYSGTGLGNGPGSNCWCVNTFTPGSFSLTAPTIGSASMGKTGFGDTIVRAKGLIYEKANVVVAAGVDLRLPSGDAGNFLGTGATSVKPFMAVSLYTNPLPHGIVLAPHFDIGYQYSGSSVLAGLQQGTPASATLNGQSVNYLTYPFQTTSGKLPDIFSWAAGTEVALNRYNTVLVDFLGNEIGLVNGVPSVSPFTLNNVVPPTSAGSAGAPVTVKGLFADGSRTSFGQYSGAFGYKVRIKGNLVATFQALVRFDHNGLRAGFTPLYGLGYSFE
ncbi:MAG TPA: hypothetical protein VGL53_03105 [Bryobacteraceae bacterium]|jgi:hypothetical protein